MENKIKAYRSASEIRVESTLSQYDFRPNYVGGSQTAQSGYILSNYLNREYKNGNLRYETYEEFMYTIGKCHEKYNMMYYATQRALEAKHEFEVTQNMDIPCLFGEDETTIRFYVESMFLFTRAALDYAAGLFSCYMLTFKIDSFNKLCKNILKDRTRHIELAEMIEFAKEGELNVINLLSGNEKGKALRDQIAHKNSIRLEYKEYKEGSEKERLYIVINKTFLVFEDFLNIFCTEAELIMGCFENYIKEKVLQPRCMLCQEKARCAYCNNTESKG